MFMGFLASRCLKCWQRIDLLALSEIKLGLEGLSHVFTSETEEACPIHAGILGLDRAELVIRPIKIPVDREFEVLVSTIVQDFLVQDVF